MDLAWFEVVKHFLQIHGNTSGINPCFHFQNQCVNDVTHSCKSVTIYSTVDNTFAQRKLMKINLHEVHANLRNMEPRFDVQLLTGNFH